MIRSGVTALLVMLACAALVAAFVVFQRRRWRSDAGYADPDETSALLGVMAMAASCIAKDDPRSKQLSGLRWRVACSNSNWFGYRFQHEDVLLVAPLAEQWLSGALPHLLAPEYDDDIRLPLLRLKTRMRANGLWPMD